MMTSLHFHHPWLLTMLLLVPLLAWLAYRRHPAALQYPSVAWLQRLPAGRRGWARHGSIVLSLSAAVLLVVALAEPRWPDETTRIPTEGIAIGLVVDVSGSMDEKDYLWQGQKISRLDAVKKVFGLFVAGGQTPSGETLPGRPNDLLALVVFGTRPETISPLTLSHDVLLKQLQEQEAKLLPSESQTNIGDALAWTLSRLRVANKHRQVIVLLTDGEHNVASPALLPREAAQLPGSVQVPVYVIDAGQDHSQSQKEQGVVDRGRAKKILQDVAAITKGRYFAAADTRALAEACAEIDRLERAPIVSYRYRRYFEGYSWLGLGAFALLLTGIVLDATVWRRVL